MLPAPDLPRNKMLVLSLVQGLILLLLWRALNQDIWPSQTPVVNIPLWIFTIRRWSWTEDLARPAFHDIQVGELRFEVSKQ